jgi:hypothetical protein
LLFDFSASAEKSLEVSRTMHNPQNVNTVREWPVKDEHLLETGKREKRATSESRHA